MIIAKRHYSAFSGGGGQQQRLVSSHTPSLIVVAILDLATTHIAPTVHPFSSSMQHCSTNGLGR